MFIIPTTTGAEILPSLYPTIVAALEKMGAKRCKLQRYSSLDMPPLNKVQISKILKEEKIL
jgi:hypothetical protein